MLLAAFLNGRAWERTIRAENAAITRLRLQNSVTKLAFVEPLTKIDGHAFNRGMATFRACQRGIKDDGLHFSK